jgi:hypothetical protein
LGAARPSNIPRLKIGASNILDHGNKIWPLRPDPNWRLLAIVICVVVIGVVLGLIVSWR